MAAHSRQRYGQTALLVGVVAAVLASGVAAGHHWNAQDDGMLPGVWIAGVYVGGLDLEEAEFRLGRHLEAMLAKPITFYLAGQSWEVSPRQLGAKVDLERTVASAYAVGREGTAWQRAQTRLALLRRGVDLPVNVQIDESVFAAWLESIASHLERPPQDASIHVDAAGRLAIKPSQAGYRLDRAGILDRVRAEAVRPFGRSVRLAMETVAPEVTTDDVMALGISGTLSSFTTRFDPTDHNRTANIRIAAGALNGLILAPGQTFSFNETVGPRVEAAGYKEAPVIIDGELVPDIGGGVCQVSSTLYVAALLAGMRVTSRTPHSIPSAYVPLGQDATVVYGAIDFRFQNDTDRHVVIHAAVDGNQLRIAFYGQPHADGNVRLESEVTQVTPRGVKRAVQPDLAPGEQRVVREGRDGYAVNVWRIVEGRDGNVSRELVSRSVYSPRDQVVWVGAAKGSALSNHELF